MQSARQQTAQEAIRDAYRRATAPGASRWERRRWMKQYEQRRDVLADAVTDRDQLLELELARLDSAIDDLLTEHSNAELAASRARHGVEIDYGPDLGW